MVYKAEKVALPTGRKQTGLTASVRQLGIGDSFLIPTDEVKDSTQRNLFVIASRLKYSITTRTIEGEGLRVWRTKGETKIQPDLPPDEEPMSKDEKLANLRALMSGEIQIAPEAVEEVLDNEPITELVYEPEEY